MADLKIYKYLECSKGDISKYGKRIAYSINTTENLTVFFTLHSKTKTHHYSQFKCEVQPIKRKV